MTPLATQWLTEQGFEVKHEFSTPWGVCDVVGISVNQSSVEQRLRSGQHYSVGPARRVALLLEIPDTTTSKGITLITLKKRFKGYISASQLNKDIDILISRKFVVRRKTGSLQKLNCWNMFHKKIIAIELKLTKIQTALAQASNNNRVADYSYVGLPDNVATRIMKSLNQDSFRFHGVGLLAIGTSSCRVLIPPRHNASSLDPVITTHALERFWPKLVTSTSTCAV